LQSLLREIEKVREEAAATVADVITAKEEQQIADMISGISQDSTSKELQEMRDLRQQVKAGARISRELAGTDTNRMEADFMDYAQKSASNAEFDALIGLAGSAEKASPAADTADKSRLPEA
jgi:phage shock protein A